MTSPITDTSTHTRVVILFSLGLESSITVTVGDGVIIAFDVLSFLT